MPVLMTTEKSSRNLGRLKKIAVKFGYRFGKINEQ